MTPIRRQYLRVKHAHPDALVLFRLGDFYETFEADAETLSRAVEITLTSRSMGKDARVPMAGVPAHALESYLARLIKQGHKVAICEQLSEPAPGKGLVERDVVRVVTPGTVLESALLEQKTNNYLAAAVIEEPWAGLAYVDATTGEFAAVQLEASQLPLELGRVAPAELLLPSGAEPPAVNPANPDAPPPYTLTPLPAGNFGLEWAEAALLEHYGVVSLEAFGCQHLPLAARAAGAIVDYLRQTYKSARLRLAPLAVYSTARHMTLDAVTRRNLELFQAGRGESREHSLLATLDLTQTAMGGRLLRRWLGQPLLDLPALHQRLDAVQFFFDDAFRRAGVTGLLRQLPDLERILGRVKAGTAAPRDLAALQRGLRAAEALAPQLEGAAVSWLQAQLTPVPEAAALLERAIADDPAGDVGEGNVIRDGFSPELDELKGAARNARQFIAALEQRERERSGIRSLKIGFNQVFGYYIEVSKSNLPQVPADYLRKQTLSNGERFITPELKEQEALALNARERIEALEKAIYRQVCAQLAEHGPAIYRLAAGLAQVDVFAALAEVAARNGYNRPVLNDGPAIVIKEGRHPVVERVLPPGSYVPNDVNLSNAEARLIVLTGPNMAGKSTYIRQAALIALLAQIGSFVPAASATIGLVDRIFTRLGLQDDLTVGQSTFMVEMLETAAILNQATPRSLVILDEIGRGTSTYDGLAIARAVIEHLHNDPRLGCKTLFATHYHELTELAKTLPGVRNFSVAVAEEEGRVIFLRRITPGGADKSYGVHVAQLAGLPRGVVNRAWDVLAELERPAANSGARRGGRRGRAEPAQQMALLNPASVIAEELLALDVANLTPLEAINHLYRLQQKAKQTDDSG